MRPKVYFYINEHLPNVKDIIKSLKKLDELRLIPLT
jgi:hypothetical protein